MTNTSRITVRVFATITNVAVSADRRSIRAVANTTDGVIAVRAAVRYHPDDGDGLAAWTGPGATLLALAPGRPVEIRGDLDVEPPTLHAHSIVTTRSAAHVADAEFYGDVESIGPPVSGWWPVRCQLPGGEAIAARAQLPGPGVHTGRWLGYLTLTPLRVALRPAQRRNG